MNKNERRKHSFFPVWGESNRNKPYLLVIFFFSTLKCQKCCYITFLWQFSVYKKQNTYANRDDVVRDRVHFIVYKLQTFFKYENVCNLCWNWNVNSIMKVHESFVSQRWVFLVQKWKIALESQLFCIQNVNIIT